MILVIASDVYCSDHFHTAWLVAITFDLDATLRLDSERPGRRVSSAVVETEGIQILDAPFAPYKKRCQPAILQCDVFNYLY